jgi:hypothetical protein
MALNDDALDDQRDRFDRARALAAAAQDEWLRYRDMEAGRPTMKASAKPAQPMSRQDYVKHLDTGLAYYDQQRKAKR